MNSLIKFGGIAIFIACLSVWLSGCSTESPPARQTTTDTKLKLLGEVELVPTDSKGLRSWMQTQSSDLILVDYWATWCAPCTEKFPQVWGLQSQYSDRGLKVIGVSLNELNDKKAAAEFLSTCGVSSPQWIARLPSSEAFTDFELDQLPTYRLFDKQGNVLETLSGDMKLDEVISKIESHLKLIPLK